VEERVATPERASQRVHLHLRSGVPDGVNELAAGLEEP